MQLKRFSLSILVVVLLLSLAVFSASAETIDNTMAFAVETNSTVDSNGNVVVNSGDEIEVKVEIKSNPGVAAFQVNLSYNPEVLELDADSIKTDLYTVGTVVGDIVLNNGIQINDGEIIIITDMFSADDDLTVTGTFATLTFKVLDTCASDAVEITKASAYNAAAAKVETSVENLTFDAHKAVTSVETKGDCVTDTFVTYTCECGDSYAVVTEVAVGAHTSQYVPQQNPTCVADGTAAGYKCSVCEAVLSGFEPITAKGAHGETYESKAAVAATCTTTGSTAELSCRDCNEVLTASTVVDKLSHDEQDLAAIEATCTQTGLTAGKQCKTCGLITTPQTVVEKVAHKEKELPAVAATCTTTGLTAGKQCEVCNATTVAQEVVALIAHDYNEAVTAPTCQTGGYTVFTCKVCAFSYTGANTPVAAHTVVVDPAVEPTVSAEGRTEGSHCSVCNTIITQQFTIARKSLTWLWILIAVVVVLGVGAAAFFLSKKKKA